MSMALSPRAGRWVAPTHDALPSLREPASPVGNGSEQRLELRLRRDGGRPVRAVVARPGPLAVALTGGPIAPAGHPTFHRIGGVPMSGHSGRMRFLVAALVAMAAGAGSASLAGAATLTVCASGCGFTTVTAAVGAA